MAPTDQYNTNTNSYPYQGYDPYYDASAHNTYDAQHSSDISTIGLLFTAISWMVTLIVVGLMLAGMWKMFVKAGRKGYEALISGHNNFELIKMVGRPGWWFFLFMIPVANIVFWFMLCIDVAHSFGKSTGFGVLTAFFPFVCFPILGFGKAPYLGPSVVDVATPAAAQTV